MRFLIILSLILLAGCSQYKVKGDIGLPPIPKLKAPEAGVYKVELLIFDTMEELQEERRDKFAAACARVYLPQKKCKVYMQKDNIDGYIAHEMRHCTNGYWHKKL